MGGVDGVRAGRCADRLGVAAGVELDEFVAHVDDDRGRVSEIVERVGSLLARWSMCSETVGVEG